MGPTFGPDDDGFHELSDRWWETEPAWFSIHVPARRLGGWLYTMVRPNIGTVAGGAWIWDDTAHLPWDVLYSTNYSALPLPPDADLRDVDLPTGVRIRVVEPTWTYDRGYDDPGRLELELRFTGMMTPQPLTAVGSTFGSAHHFDQLGRVNGRVTVNGERLDVDCLAMRDRTWGPRPERLPRQAAYVTGAVTDEHAFLAVTGTEPDGGDPIAYGFLRRDGRTIPLASGARSVERDREHGHARRVTIAAVDVDGRTLRAVGEPVSRIIVNRHSFIDINSLVRWDVDGEEGWGEDQDMWPVHRFAAVRRARAFACEDDRAAVIDLRPHVRPGDTILVGQGTAEPRALVEALVEQRHELPPVRVFVGVSYTGLLTPEHADVLRFSSFGALGRTAALADAGVLDVLPIHVGLLPALIRAGRLTVDVVFAEISTAVSDGHHSLGLVADYLPAAIQRARCVIAETNERVPFTFGDTLVPASALTATIDDDRPLIEVERRAPLPEDERIAEHIAGIVPDGATIQIGIGGTPEAVLARLHHRRDLGIHSGLLSDALLDLIEDGAVTNARKAHDEALTVAGALLGTDRLYRWADRNPTLTLRSLDHTHDASVLARQPAFHAVNSAIEVDLAGQVNAEVAAGRYIGAVGGAGAFARAAAVAPVGRSIVAVPATAARGTVSRIVEHLPAVTTPRSDADLVVTEHGVADLRGASLAERRERLLAIAAPHLRDRLEGRP